MASDGVWRLVGLIINGINTNHPVLSSFLAVLTHIITVCLFFRVSQLLLKKTGLSLVLALSMGIFPWGYQTIVNVMGYTPMVTALIFWANLLLLISFSDKRAAQMPLFFLTYLSTFLAQLNYENLAFAFMVSGVILWIDEDLGKMRWKSISQNILRRWSGLGPLLGSLTYLVLYKITLTETIQMDPGFNLESILSVYFYQYTNYFIFQPWFRSDTRNLIFFGWDGSKVLIFILLLSILFLTLAIFRPQTPVEQKPSNLGNGLLFYIFLLLQGASFVYIAAGGYSLDTRKKYALIPLMLLLFGWLWRTFIEPRFQISRKTIAVLMTLGVIGVSTTWLVHGVYRFESLRYHALSDFLVANQISGEIQIQLKPDIQAAWPKMGATLGFGFYDDWVLNLALKAKGGQSVEVTENTEAVKLYWEPKLGWQVLRR